MSKHLHMSYFPKENQYSKCQGSKLDILCVCEYLMVSLAEDHASEDKKTNVRVDKTGALYEDIVFVVSPIEDDVFETWCRTFLWDIQAI